jgi:hypothetical protein
MNRNHSLDPCAPDCPCGVLPAEFVRLRYFFGQHLGVVDLADEQSYLVGKQRFHNLRLHGAGVLCGLQAERYAFPQGAPATNPATVLRVRRGAALDPCGREIVVGWDHCIDVAAWFAQHPEARPQPADDAPAPNTLRLWVALCYRECPSDPAPAPRDPCGCDAGGCEFARIREGFELKLLTDAEAELLAATPPGATWAGLVAEEVLAGPLETAYARALALFAGTDCPEAPAHPCLLLARFTATIEDPPGQVVDITAPDNAIPERLSLLPTALLQQGQLRALSAAATAELIGTGPRLATVTFLDGTSDSGTLAIEILTNDEALSRDPFAAPAQLTVTVARFQDDGTWTTSPPFTAQYVPLPLPRLELEWAPASGLAEGRYRVLIENDPAQPVVDARMRPLTPLRWARHFRLEANPSGNLVLAESLYP